MKHVTPILLLIISSLAVNAQTQIRFYTTMGEFTVEMSDSLTPITSGNFVDLTEQGYYDGIIFHRVIDNFMIQGLALAVLDIQLKMSLTQQEL